MALLISSLIAQYNSNKLGQVTNVPQSVSLMQMKNRIICQCRYSLTQCPAILGVARSWLLLSYVSHRAGRLKTGWSCGSKVPGRSDCGPLMKDGETVGTQLGKRELLLGTINAGVSRPMGPDSPPLKPF